MCRCGSSIDVARSPASRSLIPIVVAGSVRVREAGHRDDGQCSLRRGRCTSAQRAPTTATSRSGRCVDTPDERLNTAFAWAQGRHRQGHGHQPAARHRTPRRLSHLRRQRASRLRLVLRARRAVDRAGASRLRRLRRHPHRPRLPAEVSARRRQDPARDLAERVADSRGSPTMRIPGPAPTPRRCT